MTNIKKITLYKFFSSLDFALPIQALFLVAKGMSFGEVMILSSVTLVAGLIFEIPTGFLGDKIGRKKSLIFGSIIFIVSWLLWYFAPVNSLFFVCAVLFGLARSFASGSDQAFIYDDLEGKEMSKWFGIYSSASVFGSAIAALVTGIINIDNSLVIFYQLYLFIIISQFVALFFLLCLKEKPLERQKQNTKTSFLQLLKEGFHILFASKKLRNLLLLFIFTSPFSIFLMNSFQLYFEQAQVNPQFLGYGVLISSLFAGVLKIMAHHLVNALGVRWAVFLSNILPSLIWMVMAFMIHPILSIVVFVMADGFGNLKDPIFADLFNKDIPSYIRATTLSTITLLASIYLAIMNPLLGLIAEVNLGLSFIICGLIIGFSALFFQIGFAKHHH